MSSLAHVRSRSSQLAVSGGSEWARASESRQYKVIYHILATRINRTTACACVCVIITKKKKKRCTVF